MVMLRLLEVKDGVYKDKLRFIRKWRLRNKSLIKFCLAKILSIFISNKTIQNRINGIEKSGELKDEYIIFSFTTI